MVLYSLSLCKCFCFQYYPTLRLHRRRLVEINENCPRAAQRHYSPSVMKPTQDSSAAADAATTSFADGYHQARRRICNNGCDRPVNVCLCHTLPPNPIPTSTKIVILHHPHERRHKLATVPILPKCLRNCEIIVGRKLKYGDSQLLDSLYDQACGNPNLPRRALYLFPGLEALPLAEVNQGNPSQDDKEMNDCVLIAFDGTWKHGKEMVLASLPFLSKFSFQVCLDFDEAVDGGTIFDSDLTLRKEPFGGCMSTMEAIARSLHVLEPNGTDIESKIIEVLRAMVSFQAHFMKPMKPRQKMLKKVKGLEVKDSL